MDPNYHSQHPWEAIYEAAEVEIEKHQLTPFELKVMFDIGIAAVLASRSTIRAAIREAVEEAKEEVLRDNGL